MRGAMLSLPLLGILLLGASPRPADGLCNLVNGTTARCHDLEDAKYIDTYDLEILTTSVSEDRLYPGIFRNLSSLRHLDLSMGDVEHIDPGTFRSLHELHSLDLSYNKIATLRPDSFDGLKKLHTLSMRKNALTDIPSAVLALKNLKFLDLATNPLNCSCATLKTRDILVNRGVHLSKRSMCSSPTNLKSKPLLAPEVQVICMYEEQDAEMQMDQAAPEGSGEAASGDPFEDSSVDKLDEEEHDITVDAPATSATEIETPAPVKLEPELPIAIGPTVASTVPTITEELREELFFSEENNKRATTVPVTSSTKSIEEIETTEKTDSKSLVRPNKADSFEGSGEEDDLREGSGIEGSGTGVPPISWDLPDDENDHETTSSGPAKTSTEEGWFSSLWDAIAGTSAPPDDDNKKDLALEEEEFINASSEPTLSSSPGIPVDERIGFPSVVSDSGKSLDRKTDTVKSDGETVNVGKVLDTAQSGKVRVEEETNAEATDASPARQHKQGMGSYVVLAALLAVLGALLGFAAYKGDYCKKKRKRNDVEGGTELKDMTKSLLEAGNGPQPKIASNGNMENVPLVCTSPPDDSKLQRAEEAPGDASRTRYSAVSDAADPVKPPRKSFLPHDEPEKALANGKSHQEPVTSSAAPEVREPVCLRTKSTGDAAAINGGDRHDSLSSLGTDSRELPLARTSPRRAFDEFSTPTNGSLGTIQGLARPPLSPGAQRVKITLQDNPDSVPKTPILITRTKAGENLVKTP